ncbi:MAG: COX15/CtaA family protein [Thermaerobacter sp.]|nr:COX15/CtaA family protein [Thermaerobacter sp.]
MLARVTNILMFVVLMAGFLVTETGSAQGCGRHWPLCDGHFTPPFDLHGFVEYGHRFVSGIEGLLVLWVAVWAWRSLRRVPEVKVLAILMLLFTYIQAFLGAEAVLFPTSPFILATHFGVSLIAFAATLLLDVRVHQAANKGPDGALGRTWRIRPVPQRLKLLVWLTAIYIIGLVYLGALVSHTATGLLCDGWPFCRGSLFPPLAGELWIPYLHRVAALVAVLLLVWIYRWARRLTERPDVRAAALWSLILILSQALSGWYLVASQITLGAIMIHITLMTLLFGVFSYLALQVAGELPAESSP